VIPPEIIEQVRDAADVVQLIGEHVELKRTGTDFRGPCPFHGGKSRNFSVVPRKQMYHCFVCHESGDVFTFWMKRFGLDYPTAVREIAGKVGIVVPEGRQSGPDPNELLYSALGVAAEWYQRRLREHEDAGHARAYLGSRGLGTEVSDEFGLGYAPNTRETFVEAMTGLGLEQPVLVEAGLLVRREDGSIAPRFRGRLLFPIADVRGRVVGFGGRILGDGEPKYLNSPETPVFHKGTLLYLLDRARSAIRTEGLAVVVEGYLDAIRLHAAGITCAVAPLGTALTTEQGKVLRRYTRQVMLSYDADLPGLRSTFRAGDELLRQAVAVSVLSLPAGEDPDTLVAKGGAEAFRELMAQAMDLLDRKIQLLERKNLFADTPGKRRALDRLLPTIRAAADPITRELYIGRVAERTGVAKAVLEQEVEKSARPPGRAADPRAADRPPGEDDVPIEDEPGGGGQRRQRSRAAVRHGESPQERMLVRLMLSDRTWAARAARELTPALFRHAVYRELAEAALAGAQTPPSAELARDWEEMSQPFGAGFDAEGAFAGASQWLKERERNERLAEIDRLAVVADEEEKRRLLDEKEHIIEALRATGRLTYRRRAFKTEREPT
jgi:DNA primase